MEKSPEAAVLDFWSRMSTLSLGSIWCAWFGWIHQTPIYSKMPWSGDVQEFIQAWGRLITQFGFINVNYALDYENSNNPRAEVDVNRKFSYGRQLGRILDVLTPLVRENRDLLESHMRNKADLKEFLDMSDEIYKIKQEALPDINQLAKAIEKLRKAYPSEKYQEHFNVITEKLDTLRNKSRQ